MRMYVDSLRARVYKEKSSGKESNAYQPHVDARDRLYSLLHCWTPFIFLCLLHAHEVINIVLEYGQKRISEQLIKARRRTTTQQPILQRLT